MRDHDPSSHPPDWFVRQISRGLAALLTLRLDSHPAADTVDMVRKVWAQALWPARAWDEQIDTARIGEAFRRVAEFETRWPAPSTLLRHLPDRPRQPQLLPPRLPPDRLTELRHLLDGLKRKLKGEHDEHHPRSQD